MKISGKKATGKWQVKLIIVSFVNMPRIKVQKNGTQKDFIMLKAAAVFRMRGYAGASMRELAEAVGVEAASLYNHIGSKAELLQHICVKVARAFTGQLNETELMQGSYREKLEKIIRFHIGMMLQDFDEVYVANHDWKFLTEPVLSSFISSRRLYEKRLITLLELGIQNKEFRTTDPYVAVLTILSAVRGIEFWQRSKKNITAKKLEDEMVKHLLNGIIL